jgi:hypothetical protein
MSPLRCEITGHASGPAAFGRHLTLEVDAPYDVAFHDRLKTLPRREWAWDEPHRRWWVAGRHRETVCRWAQQFPAAYLIEGRTITNLKTGLTVTQLNLFEGQDDDR